MNKEQKECIYCKELINSKANICSHCSKSQNRLFKFINKPVIIIGALIVFASFIVNFLLIVDYFKKETNLLVSLSNIEALTGEVKISVINTGNLPGSINGVRLLIIKDNSYINLAQENDKIRDSIVKNHYPRIFAGNTISYLLIDTNDFIKTLDGKDSLPQLNEVSYVKNDTLYVLFNYKEPTKLLDSLRPLVKKEIQLILQKAKHYSNLKNDIQEKFNYKISIKSIPLISTSQDENFITIKPNELKILTYKTETKYELFQDFDDFFPHEFIKGAESLDYYLEIEKVDFQGNVEIERKLITSTKNSPETQFKMNSKKRETLGKISDGLMELRKNFSETPDSMVIQWSKNVYKTIPTDSNIH